MLKTASATFGKLFAIMALGSLVLGTALGTAHAQVAQSSRIAWLSPERIYNESKLARLAGDKLKEEFSPREKALNELGARLKTATERYTKDEPTLGEQDRVKRQREVVELDKDFQRRQREFKEDLSQRTNEERAAIAEKATRIIRQLALTEGFDIVLQDAVWANPRIDITDKVLAALDK
ncbi:outer membrane protein [Massilia umbonata]|uniref:Outer membrane protein n=1 Tax=Pseudoduganella umbonata TaxID=864828 RepID=A0A4P8HPW7_9BURK|nr:OmpH family outer membrane protein [Pseudoduganella umbonata]MBB3221339.1 outer membrane protein [Pseudoduganella umbonata]QCP10504.1 OmpH family outer membrane protein [Pseudoduganella umbonata]